MSLLALACALTTLNPKFRHPTLRPYRAGMFAGLGLSALVFTTHGIMLYGLEIQVKRMSLDRMAVMAILNLIGAYVYVARVGSLPRNSFSDPDVCSDTGEMVAREI